MSRIPPLDPDDADDEAVAEFLRTAAEGWYEDTAYFGVIAHRPALLQHLVVLFEQFPRSGGIDTALLELMRLKIARKHGCAYCGTVRTAAVRDEVAAEEQALFAGDLEDEAFTDRERLAVDLADRLSEDALSIDDAFFAELRVAFTDDELVELLLFASLEVGLDRFCIALRLDATEESRYPSDLEYPWDPESQHPE